MTQVTKPDSATVSTTGAECFARAAILFLLLPRDFATPTKRLQSGRKYIQSHDPRGIATFDGGSGHAVDHARLFALRDRHTAGLFHLTQALRAVLAHTGHQHADGE